LDGLGSSKKFYQLLKTNNMGQYYKWVNISKQEVVNPWELGGVAKAWEWLYSGNSMKAIHYLMLASSEQSSSIMQGGIQGEKPTYTFGKYQNLGGGDIHADGTEEYLGRWAGDRVVLVGDYDASNAYAGHSKWCKSGCDIEHLKDITLDLVAEFNRTVLKDGGRNPEDLLGERDRAGGQIRPDIVIATAS
jgi:hypothetical protein